MLALNVFKRISPKVAARQFSVHAHGKCGGAHSLSAVQKQSLHSQIVDYLHGTTDDFSDVLEKNKQFAVQKDAKHPEYFPRTGKSQAPKYLYMGCSDARANPNMFMGFENDEVFVTRTIGNIIPPGDLSTTAVMEFSLGVLKIPHIVVCGHTECGAVKAVLGKADNGGTGFLEIWLRHLRDVRRLHYKELEALVDPKEKEDRLAELNVVEQCFNVLKTPVVQKLRAESFENPNLKHSVPIIHGVVYDVRTGLLKKLPLDFLNDVEQCKDIYNLYQTEGGGGGFWDNAKK